MRSIRSLAHLVEKNIRLFPSAGCGDAAFEADHPAPPALVEPGCRIRESIIFLRRHVTGVLVFACATPSLVAYIRSYRLAVLAVFLSCPKPRRHGWGLKRGAGRMPRSPLCAIACDGVDDRWTRIRQGLDSTLSPIARAWCVTAIRIAISRPSFADATARPHLFALYAFTLEIARVTRCGEPGACRRDPAAMVARCARTGSGDRRAERRCARQSRRCGAARHDRPVQSAVCKKKKNHPLLDLIDARLNDLYDDPFADLNQLEGYCGETFSAPLRPRRA